MNIDITFPAPTTLVPTAQTYARTIKRPDIKIEFTKDEAYEYAIPDDVPSDVQEGVEPVLTALGALLLDRWVCVAPGIEKIETLIGPKYVPWWYVYTYGTMHGGWDQPDELVTRPLCSARAPEEAIRLALIEVVRNELDVQSLYEAEQQFDDVPQ